MGRGSSLPAYSQATRCSRSIRHARRGLFAALLTRLAWVRCSRGVVVTPLVTGIERWVCGER